MEDNIKIEKAKLVLDKLQIQYEIISHKKLFRKEDREGENIDFKGAVCTKNLLVKEQSGIRRGKMYLIITSVDKKVDLKKISNELNTARFTFANDEELENTLGISKGNASILNFSIKCDSNVTVIIDRSLLNESKIAAHPNVNSMSVIFDVNGINKILKYYNIEYCYLDM